MVWIRHQDHTGADWVLQSDVPVKHEIKDPCWRPQAVTRSIYTQGPFRNTNLETGICIGAQTGGTRLLHLDGNAPSRSCSSSRPHRRRTHDRTKSISPPSNCLVRTTVIWFTVLSVADTDRERFRPPLDTSATVTDTWLNARPDSGSRRLACVDFLVMRK